MNVSPTGAPDVLGQVQVTMLRKAMDMAVQNNAKLLSALPGAPAKGSGAAVDAYA